MKSVLSFTFLSAIAVLASSSCSGAGGWGGRMSAADSARYYHNPILDSGAEPYAVYYDGYYYYTQGGEDRVVLWKTADLADLRQAETRTVYTPPAGIPGQHMWAPELHRIDGKWYIYYTADDGFTDHHRLYVAVNPSVDPMEGTFSYASCLSSDWGIHPTTFEVKGRRYLLWCGWPYRRIGEENQCIYIAPMRSPTEVDGERVLISRPQYVWERQWVSPDGNRLAHPTYVNENPQAFVSRDRVFVYYGASGSWTPYYCVGKLEADIDSDLLDPASWHKSPEPVFRMNIRDSVFSVGGICLVSGPQDSCRWMLYHARTQPCDEPGSSDSRTPRLQPISLDSCGEPQLGFPFKLDTLLERR